MKHSKIFTPTRSIAMLVLAGAITLPLQGCNEDLLPAEVAADTGTSQIDGLEGHAREHAILGGLFYDEWAEEAATTPTLAMNPLMTALGTTYAGTVSVGDSWRCKTCHGWDYKGADGQYGPSNSKYTGSPGILDAAELSIADLMKFLTDGKAYPANAFRDGSLAGTYHAFGTYMNSEEIEALAAFIKFGTLNTNDYIGKYTKETYGDGANGAALYASTGDCVTCHGADGTDIDFDSTAGVEFVGTIGIDNPWEMLHKIRFGQPGSSPAMPAGYDSGLSTQDAVDIMTHTQTLPES